MWQKMSLPNKLFGGLALLQLVFNIVLYYRHMAFQTTEFYPWSGWAWFLIFLALAIPADDPKLSAEFKLRTVILMIAIAIAGFVMGRTF